MSIVYCYLCQKPFQPEDFSTYYSTDIDTTERLAHDDCLEELFFEYKKMDNPVKIFEFGHKFWGENSEENN